MRIKEDAFSDDTLKIDHDSGVIFGVRVLGRESKNGRIYSQNALEEAADHYEGVSVNLDHPDDPSAVRGIAEGWGILKNNRVSRDGVYGDLHYIRSHNQTPAILERAERFPSNFGLSHNASGVVSPSEDDDSPDIVESIESVESVDLVSKPATNRGLFESHKERGNSMPKTKTVRKVLERKRGKVAARIRKLLEQDDFAMMAEEPVDVQPDMSPVEQVEASIESLILSVLRDESLDADTKLEKITGILGVEETLAAIATEGPAEEAPSEDPMDAAPAEEAPAPPVEDELVLDELPPEDEEEEEDEKLPESIMRRFRRLEKRDIARTVLESHGLTLSQLSATKRKLLERCRTTSEMQEVVEGFAGNAFRHRNQARPIAQSAIRESANPGGTAYDDLKRQALQSR